MSEEKIKPRIICSREECALLEAKKEFVFVPVSGGLPQDWTKTPHLVGIISGVLEIWRDLSLPDLYKRKKDNEEQAEG